MQDVPWSWLAPEMAGAAAKCSGEPVLLIIRGDGPIEWLSIFNAELTRPHVN